MRPCRLLVLAAFAFSLSACVAGPERIGNEPQAASLRGEVIDETLDLGVSIVTSLVDQSVRVRDAVDGKFIDGGSEFVDSNVAVLVHNFSDQNRHVRLDSMTYTASDGSTRSLSVQPATAIPDPLQPLRQHIASSNDEPLVAGTGLFWFVGAAETNLLESTLPMNVTITASPGGTRSLTVILHRPTYAEFLASKPPFASRGFAYEGYFE